MNDSGEPKPCKAVNVSSGLPCKNNGRADHDGLCSMHYKRAHGLTMPQSLKKVRALRYTPVSEQLAIFGMTNAEITKLRRAIPQIDSILIGGDDLRAAVDLAARILLIRTIAQPVGKSVADCAVILARFALETGEISEIERRTLERYESDRSGSSSDDRPLDPPPSAPPSHIIPLDDLDQDPYQDPYSSGGEWS